MGSGAGKKKAKRLRKNKNKSEVLKDTGIKPYVPEEKFGKAKILEDLNKRLEGVSLEKPFPFYIQQEVDPNTKELCFKANLELFGLLPIYRYPCFPMPMYLLEEITKRTDKKEDLLEMSQQKSLKFMMMRPAFLPFSTYTYSMPMLLSASKYDPAVIEMKQQMEELTSKVKDTKDKEEVNKLLTQYRDIQTEYNKVVNDLKNKEGKKWSLLSCTYDIMFFYSQVKDITYFIFNSVRDTPAFKVYTKAEKWLEGKLKQIENKFRQDVVHHIMEAESELSRFGTIKNAISTEKERLEVLKACICYTNNVISVMETFILRAYGVDETLDPCIVGYKGPPIGGFAPIIHALQTVQKMESLRRTEVNSVWCGDYHVCMEQITKLLEIHQNSPHNTPETQIMLPDEMPTDKQLLEIFPFFTNEYACYTLEAIINFDDGVEGFPVRMRQKLDILSSKLNEF